MRILFTACVRVIRKQMFTSIYRKSVRNSQSNFQYFPRQKHFATACRLALIIFVVHINFDCATTNKRASAAVILYFRRAFATKLSNPLGEPVGGFQPNRIVRLRNARRLFTSDRVPAQSMSGMRLILYRARYIRQLRVNKNPPVCVSTYIYAVASNCSQKHDARAP